MPNRRFIPSNRVSMSQVSLNVRAAYARAKAAAACGEGQPFILSPSISDVSEQAIKKTVNAITRDLRTLRNEENEDDYVFRPSDHAFQTALDLISDAYLLVKDDTGKPFTSPDGNGGVRLEWSKGGRTVSLVIPASENHPPYIYHRCSDAHNAERNPSAKMLADWLDWLVHG